MNFAFINDKDTLYFYPLSEYQTESLPIQGMEGARYIFTEQSEETLASQLTAERVHDDLHLQVNSEAPASLVIKDFFQSQSQLHSLTESGEYRLQLTADPTLAQGPVVLQPIELGAIGEQPEAIFLHSIQNQTTLQTMHEAVSEQTNTLTSNVSLAEPYGISSIIDHTGNAQGDVKGWVTDELRPLFQGAAYPGSTLVFMQNGEAVTLIEVPADGNWSYIPGSNLVPGTYLFSIMDADTMEPVGNPVGLVVDDAAPSRPTIGSITDGTSALAPGEYISTGPLIFSGVTERQAVVTIYDGNRSVISIQADVNGVWKVEVPLALLNKDGTFDFRITATDYVGNISQVSPSFPLSFDITPPDAPTINDVVDAVGDLQGTIASGSITDDARPTLSGTAEKNATVFIYDGEKVIASTTADSNGAWSVSVELSDDRHELTARAQDAAGNLSSPSAPWVVIVNTEKPETPVVGGDGESAGLNEVIDDFGPVTGPILNGGETDDRTPTFNGTGNAGDTVIIRDNGEEIGSVVIGEDGTWTFTPELEDGDHAISIVIRNPAGSLSDPSEDFTFKIDSVTRPETPSIDGSGNGAQITDVIDDFGPVTGPILNGGETDDRTPTFNGTGNAGDTVIIRDNGEEIGSVVIGEDGKWTFTPELEDGDHAISIVIQDEVGRQSDPSPEFVIKVDGETRPQTPSIDGSGPGISEAIDDFGPVTGPILNGGETDDRTPTFNGTGNAGDTVIIRDNGEEIGSVVIGEDGKWTFTPELEDGDHAISIVIQDEIGRQSDPSPEFVIKVDGESRPQAPVIESVIDSFGAVTGNLMLGDVTDDNRPQLNGHAEAGNRVAIYNHGQWLGEALAGPDGKWSFTPTDDLQDGEYSFTAVAINATGNPGEASEAFDLIIFTGEGPSQVARILHMGKDSGMSGQDFVTNNGSHSRLVYGELSSALTEGQRLEVSHDGGRTWTTALVDGINWASQDSTTITHNSDWTIQTRVVDESGNAGYVMSQKVTYDNAAPRPTSGSHFEDSELVINLPAAGQQNAPQVGDRVLVFGDRGASYFEHTLTQEDLTNGYVRMEVGDVKSASIAIADAAGNMSTFTNVNTVVRPETTYQVKGDESEIYGTNNFAEKFVVSDVSLLDNIKLIEGNSGSDVLSLTGSNQVLDLSSLSTRLSSIEVFDIKGSGNNTLKISLGDVLDLGLRSMYIADDTVQVAVLGDAGDVVQLSRLLPNGIDAGEWTYESFATSSGITYDVYVNSAMNAELLVQQGVTVELI